VDYLVDTNVISAGAPSKSTHPALLSWMDENADRLYLSTVAIAEIEDGIAKLRRQGSAKRASLLREWIETLLHLYAARVQAFDLEAARVAGSLSDLARGKGHKPGFADIAIAAIAMANGLSILTRNLKHFTPFEVPAIDPFAALPE
jgi:predicted nucleic acid-binding protein